jgi:hypothetical protein
MDWWFKLAMLILIPVLVIEAVLLVVPLPRFMNKRGRND